MLKEKREKGKLPEAQLNKGLTIGTASAIIRYCLTPRIYVPRDTG